ncbi:hypothetical protein KFL_004690090 [Klebsormidium nitens]|uniref:Lariat debranching enzyme C-terminal domain-containing protein n=1 Tax=Klebsormidium nitens TaxID=105231 RepID=A0A1Y1IJV3_KLENI|nr:hypothetical protein KFL_004690090 [Klebsormidium nitens]|eukprot:GAQ88917.1 hypothetical protein KFL_004690090 [Klebsormidium nitens]
MKIAVEGCAHGDLDNIYATLQHLERVQNTKIDLLICCGDFQAVRNEQDLESLACPPKFRAMNTFWKYYSGAEKVPIPTVFVGGNHEASNYLWELYYGGWAAPDIFFLGFAGVVTFGGIRIGGLSGIFKHHDFRTGHYERPPYNPSDMKSVYHVREYEVHKLKRIREPLDVFVSHDWPRGIANYGDKEGLLRYKPYFRQEVESNTLGSPPGEELLHALQPTYWFAAHLHCKFAALVPHKNGQSTRFLALDKPLPNHRFLQIIDVETKGPLRFEYDPEWLAITRSYDAHLPLSKAPFRPPRPPLDLTASRKWVERTLETRGRTVPLNFEVTAPVHDPLNRSRHFGPAGHLRNPQTEAFLRMLELPYRLDHAAPPSGFRETSVEPQQTGVSTANPEEIDLDDLPDDDALDDDGLPDDVDELAQSVHT